FGIWILVPVLSVIVSGYCAALGTLVRNREPWRWLLFAGGCVVLFALLGEVSLLLLVGAKRAEMLVGPGFYGAHLVVVGLAGPSLANVLMLRRREWFLSRWYWAGAACAVFLLGLVLLQYGVSEALFGID